MTDSHQIFPQLNSFEDYEKFKSNNFERVANKVIHQLHLPEKSLMFFSDGTNIVFSYDNCKVIKLFPPFHFNQYTSEKEVLKHLQGKLSVNTPIIESEGNLESWSYLIMNQLPGTLLETLWEKMEFHNKMIIIRELGTLIREVHALSTEGLKSVRSDWNHFINNQINHCVEHHRSKNLSHILLQQLPQYIETNKLSLFQNKSVLLTGEYTPMNILVQQTEGIWHINGLFDFGDAMLGLAEYDLLGPGAFLIQGNKQLLREFLISYGYSKHELTSTLSHQLTALMLLHEYSNLDIQIRIKDWKEKINSLQTLEILVWGVSDTPFF